MKQTAKSDARSGPRVAEPQRPRPSSAVTPGAVTPGGGIAQLAAMVNGGSRVQPLAQLKDALQQSPRVKSLMTTAAEIHQGAPPRSSAIPEKRDAGPQQEAQDAQEADAIEANPPVAQRQPAQLYTSAGGKKLSASGNYYVKDGDDTKLFVKTGAALGARGGQIVATGATETHSLATYTAYHYYADDSGGFVNDCLGLAEQLARSDKAPSARAEFRAPGTGGAGGKLFGDTHAKNTEIAQDAGWYGDEAANPAIGEAYAIAPTVEPEVGEAPYHAAAVIAKDGTDNITLEADAGTVRSRPLFDMYDTQPPGTRADANSKTFHEVYVKGFTYKRAAKASSGKKKKSKVMKPYTPSTGVLKLRTD